MDDWEYMGDVGIRMTLIMRLLEIKPSNTRYDNIINIADQYYTYIKLGGQPAEIINFTLHEKK